MAGKPVIMLKPSESAASVTLPSLSTKPWAWAVGEAVLAGIITGGESPVAEAVGTVFVLGLGFGHTFHRPGHMEAAGDHRLVDIFAFPHFLKSSFFSDITVS